MGFGGPQGHHVHARTHQQFPQIEEIVGIGAPAVQEHQPMRGIHGTKAEEIGAAGHGRGLELLLRRLDLPPTITKP